MSSNGQLSKMQSDPSNFLKSRVFLSILLEVHIYVGSDFSSRLPKLLLSCNIVLIDCSIAPTIAMPILVIVCVYTCVIIHSQFLVEVLGEDVLLTPTDDKGSPIHFAAGECWVNCSYMHSHCCK